MGNLASEWEVTSRTSALASRRNGTIAVLVWNYHDDDLPAPAADVELSIEGLPNGRAELTHYRVDREHSNAYEVWKRQGSPQQPTPQQVAELERAGQLQMLAPPEQVTVADGRVVLKFTLPRQGVSLIIINRQAGIDGAYRKNNAP